MTDFEIVLLICKSYEGRLSSPNATDIHLDNAMFSLPEKQVEALVMTEMVKAQIKPITLQRIKNIAELLALYVAEVKL